jgi:hypothetical protein
VALFAALVALVVAGCNKVTGGGQFYSLGIGNVSIAVAEEFGIVPGLDTTGDLVTFGLTAQTDANGNAKGQLTLVDKAVAANVHADLDLTIDESGSPVVTYFGEGTARANQMGGSGKVSQWDVFVVAYDGSGDGQPDYAEVMIWDPNSGLAIAWSGYIQNGNIVVH